MSDIFFQTGLFLLYIFIGYFLKKIKLLKKEDSQVLTTIIMNITLPCLFFSSGNGLKLDSEFLIFMFLGCLANVLLMMIGFFISYKENLLIRGTYMIACSGYDVGNFILPFISVFFPGLGVMYLCSFNITNVIISMGITYAVASYYVYHHTQMGIKVFLKNLFSSVSFDVYILIIIIACFHLTVPEMIIKVTSSIGSVNSFLVMMMIGIKLELHMQKSQMNQLIQILGTRFLGAIILSIITFLFPIPTLAKYILTITYFAPLVSVSSVYTKKLGYKGDIVVDANFISIMISMFMTTVILLLI